MSSCGSPSMPLRGGQPQQRGHVERVLEAEAPGDVGDAVVAVAEVVDREPLVLVDVGHALGDQRDDQHALVQDVVVLDVRAQRQRRRLRVGVEEHARCRARGRPAGRRRAPRRRSRRSGPSSSTRRWVTISRPSLPGREHAEDGERDRQREPAAVQHLGQVRGEERQVDGQERDRADDHQPRASSATGSGRRRRTAACRSPACR